LKKLRAIQKGYSEKNPPTKTESGEEMNDGPSTELPLTHSWVGGGGKGGWTGVRGFG